MIWNNNTKIIGKSFLEFDILSSTNLYAISKIKANKLDEGTVILAHGQSQGRGQRGNSWESEHGKNLLLSIVLTPQTLSPSKQFMLNKITALAVYDFLQLHLPNEHIAIKWPNDIYVNQKKIAGILIQNILSGNSISNAVVGIGINVNQTTFSSNLKATSMKMERDTSFDLKKLLSDLCFCIENWYQKLQLKNDFIIDHHYQSHLYKKGIVSNFKRENGTTFQGVILGVDEFGKLKIQIDNTIELFDLKEIQFIP